MALDVAQMEEAWIQAGGPANLAPVMAALGLQQSGGNPAAYNPNDPSGGSFSVWQINGVNLPYLESKGIDVAKLKSGDVAEGAKAAVLLYQEAGLSPWSTVNAPQGGTMVNPIITAWENHQNVFSVPGATAEGANPSHANGVNYQYQGAAQSGSYSQGQSNSQGAYQPQASGPGIALNGDNTPPQMLGNKVDGITYGPNDFHGYDLSAIPDTPGPQGGNLLGNAEQNILKFMSGQDGSYVNDRIMTDFGMEAWAMAIPQVKGLLISAAMGGWDKNLFISVMQQTQWWKTTNENQRAWQQIQATDPATAQSLIAQASAKVQDTANQMGVSLTGDQRQYMATVLAQNTATQSGTFISPGHYGWTQEQIDLMVAGAYKYNPGAQQRGLAGNLFDNYQKLAGQYMVPMTNDSIGKWVTNDFHNYYTMQGSFESGAESGFEQHLKQQASVLFPTLKAGIGAGLTPYQMTEPYRQLTGQVLEQAPETINLTDPKWRWMIDSVDPKSNQRQLMSLGDVQTQLMSNDKYGYQFTQQARDAAYQIVDKLGQAFGKIGAIF